MLCMLDFGGRFTRLNPAWERTLGFSRDELMSRPFLEFVHPDDRGRTLRQNARVRAGGQAMAFENRYLCKDGSFRWLVWHAAPNPRERTIYSMASDITAFKEAEAECGRRLQAAEDALAELRRAGPVLSVCSYCKAPGVDDSSTWSIDQYLALHVKLRLSHGLCPACARTMFGPELAWLGEAEG